MFLAYLHKLYRQNIPKDNTWIDSWFNSDFDWWLYCNQNQWIFDIYQQKAEDEKVAAVQKAAWELKFIQKKSNVHIASATATAAKIFIAPVATLWKLKIKKNPLGEIPPEVQTLTICFPDLFQEEIIKIFYNKFKPINLYRLWHMQRHRYKSYYNHNQISIQCGMLKLKKNSGTYKDFGKTFYEVWSGDFINYKEIIVAFFGFISSELHSAFTIFYGNIHKLAKVYKEQQSILPMAIKVFTNIVF